MEEKSLTKKEAFDLIEEFKEFAFRGNVVELALGVIMGGAFSKIVSSLVENIIIPIITIITPNIAFKNWTVGILDSEIHVGLFISDVLTFFVVSLVLFLFIKKFLFFFVMSKKEIKNTKQEQLLTEIRDILKKDEH
jgi:large conductance mechanosensitive channel